MRNRLNVFHVLDQPQADMGTDDNACRDIGEQQRLLEKMSDKRQYCGGQDRETHTAHHVPLSAVARSSRNERNGCTEEQNSQAVDR